MLSENPREKKRPLFFLAGLVAALSLVILLMQSSTLVKSPTCAGCPKFEYTEDVTRDIPITIQVPKKEPVKKLLKNLALDPMVDPQPLLDVSDALFPVDQGDTSEAPVGISREPDTEDPEPVTPMFLEFIAAPESCGALITKEEKMDCLNNWITKYLRENLRYPSHISGLQFNGKVILSFVVSSEGKITEVEVLRGQHEELNREARRVLEAMPDWIPARQFTKNVPMRMVIPVYFNTR